MSKKKFKDPTQFFLHQNDDMPEEKKRLAKEFANKLLHKDTCPICKVDYDLSEHVPKIIVQSGHTVCSKCLQLFFKDYKIRCPLTLKLLKRIRSVDVLPTNHTIHARLLKTLPPEKINPYYRKLALPSEILAEQPAEQEAEPEVEAEPLYGLCENHPDRVKHFYDYTSRVLRCRACVEALQAAGQKIQVVDLYEMNPNVVNELFNGDVLANDAFGVEYEEAEAADNTLNTSF